MGFNVSLSGINAANADLNVTANNIANVNTTGFKESRAEFADLFNSTSYGLSRNAIGSGVRLSGVAQQFSQGNIDQTGRSLDMAIEGEGFFTLSMNGTRVYSRAGNFQTDKSGYVVNPQGARLQVYAPSADGTRFDGTLTDLQVLATDSAPKQTGLVNLAFTLPANASEPTIATFDPSNSNSYNQSTGGVTVYDSLGVSHTQTSYFVKGANANEWQVYNYVDGQSVGAPTTLEFSNSGALLNPANGQITLDPFTPATGAGVLNLTLDVSGSTQYGEKFALRDTRQDGYASGKLTEISIDTTGVVYARYSNGADTALGQVALTNFNNPQGLQSMGNNVWTETNASGIARTGAPDTSDLGQIQSGSLEASTVDLTEQLVNMIVAQRNFQANAQMVSTQDQITQTVINIR
ncbi:MAG: flagellar hook protein FlgE [Stenotrophomonas sp.]|uniref:Flagellar hook protein FlgE n=1 Tax=Stenotrophomonas capsici TaxID=3110230 RepID=A0ABU5V7E0_9GAMM|nr:MULTISPECIES: flagellar hook protein FlgE [unclassified Stenotrophomonas]MBD9534352.1 flagellar hook protein FlgE [Stenotrophomonas sp. STM01]MEA5668420.1 flagellar hook protein FlgE [Stenotrophomonas sp. MH1]